ncbi:MAG: PorV/PorQ family protein [Elusimicrobia bacterium]|nr:PorV/PorQ family protein [Elusimicrobiota bacterium]
MGARPIAMGEAFTAVADDVNAVYWNPAGLAGQKFASIGAMHQESFQSLRHQFAGYVQPTLSSQLSTPNYKSAWGLGFISMFVPSDLERRSGLNENDVLNPLSSSEGSFGAYDLALSGSYSRLWAGNHALGGTLKLIRQVIDKDSAHSFAADMGWQWRGVIPDLSLGAVVQNLGPGVKFGTRFPLPVTFKAGAAYRVPRFRFPTQIALDLYLPRDNYPIFAFGFESKIIEFLSLRAGYRYRWYGNPLGTLSGLRAGVGFEYQSFNMDYAFAPFGDLGNSHRISVGWHFGKVESREFGVESAQHSVLSSTNSQLATRNSEQIPVAVLPLPPPLPAESTDGYTAFVVKGVPKVISARGTDFQVEAASPSGDWVLKKVAFRASLPTVQGLVLGVLEFHEPNFHKAYRFKLNVQPNFRSVIFDVVVSEARDKVSILGMFEGQWKPLWVEESGALLRAKSDTFPEALGIQYSHAP